MAAAGHQASLRFDDADETAVMMKAATWSLGTAGGIAVVNPTPSEDEIPAVQIDGFIEREIADTEAAGILRRAYPALTLPP